MAKKLLVTGLALVLAVSFAQAATLNLQATVTGAYNLDWSPAAVPADISVAQPKPLIYQVDYAFQISDLSAGQVGFGNLVFDLTLNGVGNAENLGWQANTPTFSYKPTPVTTQTVNVFADYGDKGTDSTDLKNILAGIDNFGVAANDPRGTLGQAAPYAIGTLYVTWDGLSRASLDANLWQFSTIGSDKVLTADLAGTRMDNDIVFGANIPEPATMALLGLGALGALLRRRSK